MNLQVFSNTFYQVVAKIASAGATLFIILLITRYLGADTFGEYSVVMAYILVFFLLADFGINAIVVKDFARNKKNAHENFSKILSFRILSGIGLSLVAAAIASFLPYADHIKLAIFVSVPVIAMQAVVKAPHVIFQSYLEYRYLAISTISGSAISIAILFYVTTHYDISLLELMLTLTVVSAVNPLISLGFVKNYINTKTKWIDTAYWMKFVKDAFPLGLALLVNGLMIQSDRLMLSFLSVPISVGFYTLAYRIFDLVLVLPSFFMNAYYPELVRTKDKSEDVYRTGIRKAIVFLATTGLILTICAIKFSPWLISNIWGPEMSRASLPFNILMLGSVLFFVTAPLSWMFVIENSQKVLLKVYSFALLFNVLLNLVFIPRFDYIGAAFVTVFTELFVLMYLGYKGYFLLRKSPKI